MTDRNQRIAELRQQNYSYSFIGKVLSLSPNTVKSICRRCGFEAFGSKKTKAEKLSARFCQNCGAVLSTSCAQEQKFCSDRCRRKWWKANRRITEK